MLPAGSFPGGFLTPALEAVAPLRMGRHPKPFTKGDIPFPNRHLIGAQGTGQTRPPFCLIVVVSPQARKISQVQPSIHAFPIYPQKGKMTQCFCRNIGNGLLSYCKTVAFAGLLLASASG